MSVSRRVMTRSNLLAVCGVAAAMCQGSMLCAQTTNIVFEAAVNPQNEADWLSSVTVEPGATVYVRMRVQLAGATALGLAGITHQSTLSNWRADAGDQRLEFTFPGVIGSPPSPASETSYMGRHVLGLPQTNTGRIYPFGQAQMQVPENPLPMSFNDPGNLLRFAGSRATTATMNPVWGINSAQMSSDMLGEFFAGGTDAVVFRYGVTLSASDSGARVLTTGLASLSQDRATWFLNSAGTQTLNAELGTSTNATIIVTPGPGGITLLAIGGLASVRRRRQRLVGSRRKLLVQGVAR